MVVAASTGMAQARTSPLITASRIQRPSLGSISATSVEITMMSTTLTAVQTRVRRTTVQNSASPEHLGVVVEADRTPPRRG